jgi:hypothetical protein
MAIRWNSDVAQPLLMNRGKYRLHKCHTSSHCTTSWKFFGDECESTYRPDAEGSSAARICARATSYMTGHHWWKDILRSENNDACRIKGPQNIRACMVCGQEASVFKPYPIVHCIRVSIDHATLQQGLRSSGVSMYILVVQLLHIHTHKSKLRHDKAKGLPQHLHEGDAVAVGCGDYGPQNRGGQDHHKVQSVLLC